MMDWTGVFPAATTQFDEQLDVDIPATQEVIDRLVSDGVHGIVALGTCGENNSLRSHEKCALLEAIVEVCDNRVPVVVGVSEMTTAAGAEFAAAAGGIGVDALMVLPAMVYVPTAEELTRHFRAIAEASDLPIMLYNNPPAYRVTIGEEVLAALEDVENIVAIKESAPDTRRFTDIANRFGDRYTIMAGLDDVALEGLLLGASGWVSGLTSAFPEESLGLWRAFLDGDLGRAREIYSWFMPLLHLDAGHDLVQCIKLAEEMMGRGSHRVRPPRYPLAGQRRKEIVTMIERAADTRPIGARGIVVGA